ncbi:MAG: hypothetical protein QXP77_00220 [Candidatus Aenigmatarchaeota archaeon]
MGVIKRIDLNSIEEILKKIIGASSELKLLQDEMEDVFSHLSENEKLFSNGKISKDVYNENKARLKNEANELKKKLKEKIAEAIKILENGRKIIEANRI